MKNKMKKRFLMLGLIFLLVCVLLGGCLIQDNNENQVNNTINSEKNKFVGTWYKSNYLVMDLSSDGTCSYLTQSGTWDVKDGKLVLKLSSGYNTIFTYAFSDSDLTIKLTSTIDGSTVVYTKRGEIVGENCRTKDKTEI